MESEATTVPVCRLNLLTSAARLAWLVSTPANNVKRNAALHLISTHDEDSGLPPHAPLTVLAESFGLQPSQLLAVLTADDMFGVLGSHDTSSTRVVYLNAETLITRVYKETGAFVPALQPNGTGGTDITIKLGKRAVTRDSSAPATRGTNKHGRIYIADRPRRTSYTQPQPCVATAQPFLSSVARQVAVDTFASQAAAAQVQQYLRLLALQAQQQVYRRSDCRMTAPPTEYHVDGTAGSYHNALAREAPTIAETFASTVALDGINEIPMTMLPLTELPGAELADITYSHTSDVLQAHVTPRSAGVPCSPPGKLSATKQSLNGLSLKFGVDPPISPPHHHEGVSAVSDLARADQQHTSRDATTFPLLSVWR